MFVDARRVQDGARIETDICIVGAGAAGITLAREFAEAPFRVLLLESGGLQPDPETQSLCEGKNVGFPYFDLDELRLRYFGGTTNHWTGSCRPLDEMDFETRPWVPHSGWPFGKSELEPFYRRAQTVCQLGPYQYTPQFWESDSFGRLPLRGDRVVTEVLQRRPTRFGDVYRSVIEHASNIRTYLFANVIEIGVTANIKTATHVVVATLAGNKFLVAARAFVLAAGALENARLLLASTNMQSAGLGNQHDLVGRFFMEHLNAEAAVFLPSNPDLRLDLYLPRDADEQRAGWGQAIGFLTPSPMVREREKLLNVRALFRDDRTGHGLLSTSQGLLGVAAEYKSARGDGTEEAFLKHVYDIITDIDNVAVTSYLRLFRSPKTFYLIYQVEQAPNPESRVTLTSDRDRLGIARIQLAWRFTDLERDTLRRANELIAEECGRAGVGRIRIIPDDPNTGWPSVVRRVSGKWHQMGTTRMHRNPRRGVVDEHCRLHGTPNLFVAGSSVFPTCGVANPTLTIVALALRLADHIRQELG